MAHMSLGFVNGAHRAARDTLSLTRAPPRARMQMPASEMGSAVGVIPVDGMPPKPMPRPVSLTASPTAAPTPPAPPAPLSRGLASSVQQSVQQSTQQSTQQLVKQSAQQPSDRNTLDRRLEFLTNQNRELYEQLTLLHARVRALDEKAAASDTAPPSNVAAPTNADAAAQALLVVHATCLLATPQALDNKGRVGEKLEEVPAGTELALAYPMIEAEGGPAEGGAVLMRRMNVDVATAQVTWTWVTLYDAANGSYVGSFRPIA